MARPRVFLSSTFFDLKSVRADIEFMLNQMGYEPILNERGRVPFDQRDKLETSCYREVDECDILVCIIGGRFGQASSDGEGSITQRELQAAIDSNKQVFVFVDKGLMAEHLVYLKNKDVDVKWSHADDKRVHVFLEAVQNLPRNNAIFPFETSVEIAAFLREQFAGLFQRLLSETRERQSASLASELKELVATVQRVLSDTTSSEVTASTRTQALIYASQPIFSDVQKLLNKRTRVFFTNKKEFNSILKAERFKPVDEDQWDSPEVEEWIRGLPEGPDDLIKIAPSVFDGKGDLVYADIDSWDSNNITMTGYFPGASSDQFEF